MESLHPYLDEPQTSETFELVYDGPDVVNGSMRARELADAVLGVSRAFGTTAHEHDFGDDYEVRVRDIRHASFHVICEAIALANRHPVVASAGATASIVGLGVLKDATPEIRTIISDLGAMIMAKKKLRGARVATIPTEFVDNEVRLTVPDETVILTKEQYELLLSQRVDKSIAQIVTPLAPAKLDLFEMRSGGIQLASVLAREKEYFYIPPPVEDKGKEGTEIIGAFNSLNKTSLRGTFHTLDNVHVPYKYSGGDTARLLRGFSSREPVRVFGKIRFGADGVPLSIEVKEIEFLQRDFRNTA